MATNVELATGYVTLAIDASKVGGQVAKAFSGVERTGASAGQSMGQSMAKAFEKTKPDLDGLAADVEKAEARATAAVERNATKQENAKRKVDIAQAKLNETIDKYGKESSQALGAQDRLALAQQKLEATALGARQEQDKLNRELRDAKDAFSAAERAADSAASGSESAASKYASGWRGVGQKIRRFLVGGVDDATEAADREAGDSDGASKYASGWRGVGSKLRGDLVRGVKSATNAAEDQAERGGREAGSGFKDAFKGAVAGMAAYVGVQEIGQGLWSSVQGAGELEQSVGAIGSVFKTSSGDMLAWSDTAATAVGLSKNQYNELGTVLGAQLKNGGTAMDELAPKTNELITLGADLSSMFGGTTAEAVEAMSAALRGERDPIEQYGVSLNQAAVDAKAAELGFEKVGGSLSTEANQAATLALIMEQTSDAHGNFARESDTFAHKQQVMTAEWQNLKAKIGEAFMPALTAAFGFISNKAMPAMASFSNSIKTTADWLGKTAGIWGPFAIGIGLVAAAWGAYELVMWGVAAATNAAIWPITGIILGIGLLVGAVILAYNRIGWFKDGVNAAWNGIKIAVGAVVTWFQTVAWPIFQSVVAWIGSAFSWLYTNVVLPVWGWIRTVIGDFVLWFQTYISPIIRDVVGAVGAAFSWLYVNVIQPVWAAIPGIISFAWNNLIKPVLSAIGWFLRTVVGPAFGWLYNNVVKPVFGFIGAFILFAWNNLIKPVFAAMGWFIKNVVAPVFRWLYFNVVKPVFGWIVAAAKFWWQGMKVYFNLIKWIITSVVAPVVRWLWRNVFAPAFAAIGRIVKGAWENVIRPTFNWMKGGVSAVGERFRSVKDWIGRTWSNLRRLLFDGYVAIRDRTLNPLREAARRVKDTFVAVKDGIKEAWNKLKSAVKEPIRFVIQDVVNPFIGAYNKANNFWHGENIDPLEVAGFDAGGWTGPGSKYKPAGVVHADEFVVRKESQNSISKAAPGFLDSLNRFGAKALAGIAGYAKGGRVRPLRGGTVSSGYGPRAGGFHDGIDFAAPAGTPIYAAADGRVIKAWNSPYGGGNEVQVVHDGNLHTWYAHMSRILTKAGASVKAGAKIGEVGSTGNSTGNHLHFAVFQGGWPNHRNPNSFLGGNLVGDGSGSGGGFVDPIQFVKDKIKGIFDYEKLFTKAKDTFGQNKFLQLGTGLGRQAIDGVIQKASDIAGPVINAVESGVNWTKDKVADAGDRVKVTAWADEALRATNQWGVKRLKATVDQAFIESGGDPNAVNNWDVNAKNGDPSRGIMQTIGATFRAYAMPGKNNILDPVHNMIAAIRYVLKRYGSIENIWPTRAGYADGGFVKGKGSGLGQPLMPTLFDNGGQLHEGFTLMEHRRRDPDAVLTGQQWDVMTSIATNTAGSAPEMSRAIELLEQLANSDREVVVAVDGREIFRATEDHKRRARIK